MHGSELLLILKNTSEPIEERKMRLIQKGFTLIELMIVVAIIGILAALAIPAFQEYIARSQASEGALLLGGLKTPLAEYYKINGSLPANLTTIGAKTSGKYTSNISGNASTGEYTATFMGTGSGLNAKIAAKTLILTFNTTTSSFNFASPDMDTEYLPRGCQ